MSRPDQVSRLLRVLAPFALEALLRDQSISVGLQRKVIKLIDLPLRCRQGRIQLISEIVDGLKGPSQKLRGTRTITYAMEEGRERATPEDPSPQVLANQREILRGLQEINALLQPPVANAAPTPRATGKQRVRQPPRRRGPPHPDFDVETYIDTHYDEWVRRWPNQFAAAVPPGIRVPPAGTRSLDMSLNELGARCRRLGIQTTLEYRTVNRSIDPLLPAYFWKSRPKRRQHQREQMEWWREQPLRMKLRVLLGLPFDDRSLEPLPDRI